MKLREYHSYQLSILLTVVFIQASLVSIAAHENKTWELGLKEIHEGNIEMGLEYIIYDAVENRNLIASGLIASIYRTGFKVDEDEQKAAQFENLYFEILRDDYQLDKALENSHEQFEKYYVPAFNFSQDRVIIQDSLFIIREVTVNSGITHQRLSIKFDGDKLYVKNLESGEVSSYSKDKIPKDIYRHCDYTMRFINIIEASKKGRISYYQRSPSHRIMTQFEAVKDKFSLETHLSHLTKTIQLGFGEQLKFYGEMTEKEVVKITLPKPFEIAPLTIEEFRFLED